MAIICSESRYRNHKLSIPVLMMSCFAYFCSPSEKWNHCGALKQKEMSNWIGLVVKHVLNVVMHVLHNFLVYSCANTNLHLLLLL